MAEMKIEVTHKCLLGCIHCSSNAYADNELCMEKAKCLAIINQACEIGLQKLSFSGGEPLLWDGIYELISFSKKRDSMYVFIQQVMSRIRKAYSINWPNVSWIRPSLVYIRITQLSTIELPAKLRVFPTP